MTKCTNRYANIPFNMHQLTHQLFRVFTKKDLNYSFYEAPAGSAEHEGNMRKEEGRRGGGGGTEKTTTNQFIFVMSR